MSNPEHLKKLEEGVDAWNKWRRENLVVLPNLTGASLQDANLMNANLMGADLTGADLTVANLSDAYLMGADLTGAYPVAANLQDANLINANLTGANLRGANLEDANLEDANLQNALVFDIKYNRWGRYRGIRIETCHGSPLFKRFAQDQDFIEEFRSIWWKKPLYVLWLIFADCGKSLWPWILWSISIAVGFGLIFHNMQDESMQAERTRSENVKEEMDETNFAFDVKHLKDEDGTVSVGAMIYYSVVTFTTLGFGDIVPQTQEAAWWVMAEVIIGYIRLGGLISILATKLARRS